MDPEELAALAAGNETSAGAVTSNTSQQADAITKEQEVDPLDNFWSDDAIEPDADKEQDTTNTEPDTEAADAFRNQLLDFTVGAGDFPADYDPNDPKQFHDSMTLIMQRGFVHQAETLLKPISEQMSIMEKNFEARIAAALADNNAQSTQNSALETGIPGVKDPHMRKIVQPIYETALAKAKGNTRLAVAATKRYFRDAGIPLGGKQMERQPKQGAGLDSFFTSTPSKHDATADLLK